MTPFVTFISDFGSKDLYVASVKAVILSRLPKATILDVTHDIVPFGPLFALPPLIEILELVPAGTIHLVVVDPGVGSSRRALIGVSKDHRFVFPDNGLPHLLTHWIENMRFFHLHDPRIFGGAETATFQGRDLFAPAVSALGVGKSPAELGTEIPSEGLYRDPLISQSPTGELLVFNVDRFGNVLLGCRTQNPPDAVEINLDRKPIPFVHRYQDVPVGQLGLLINSSKWLEIFCREGNASEQTGLRTGMTVKASVMGGSGRTLCGTSF